jgi:hypothetical protein
MFPNRRPAMIPVPPRPDDAVPRPAVAFPETETETQTGTGSGTEPESGTGRRRWGLMVAGGVLVAVAAGAVVALQVFRAGGPLTGVPGTESLPAVLPPTFTPESAVPGSVGAVAPALSRASLSASASPGSRPGNVGGTLGGSLGATSPAAPKTGPITAYSACTAGNAVNFTATFTTAYEFRHVFIDADGDASTGYQVGEIGADYMIENDALYRATKKDWSWKAIKGAKPLLSESGGTYRWQVQPGFGGPRVVFNAATAGGADVSTGVVPVTGC